MQSFLKNGRLFFSLERKHTYGLSWFMLPYALLQEVLYLIEPIILTTIVGVSDLLPLALDTGRRDGHHLVVRHRQYPRDNTSFTQRQIGPEL